MTQEKISYNEKETYFLNDAAHYFSFQIWSTQNQIEEAVSQMNEGATQATNWRNMQKKKKSSNIYVALFTGGYGRT
jgi:hypothetical protein